MLDWLDVPLVLTRMIAAIIHSKTTNTISPHSRAAPTLPLSLPTSSPLSLFLNLLPSPFLSSKYTKTFPQLQDDKEEQEIPRRKRAMHYDQEVIKPETESLKSSHDDLKSILREFKAIS